MRIVHIIPGLQLGGSENMLYKLLSASDRAAFRYEVVSLTRDSTIGDKIRDLGVPVRTVGLHRALSRPFDAARLGALLWRGSPDLVQTWQYHGDLIGGLAAKLASRAPVVWNVRHSTFDSDRVRLGMRWTLKACARLSVRVPTHIVCCSEAARRVHVDLGYPAERISVIPNGFDLGQFRPDAAVRRAKRNEFGIGERHVLIGLIARYNPQKDHETFLAAAARVSSARPEVRFLLCGPRITPDNDELMEAIHAADIADRCVLLGPRHDVHEVAAALDCACSSSSTEGFSNTIGEAMACAVPCVATDVGDSARIVGDTGRVVPPRDVGALAEALLDLVRMGREGRARLGARARRRIEENFGLPVIAKGYEALYRRLVLSRTAGSDSLRTPPTRQRRPSAPL